jgi:hypothetical protein
MSETGPVFDEMLGLIDHLVAQALDDVDEGRLDLEAALRTIAVATWEVGYQRYLFTPLRLGAVTDDGSVTDDFGCE